VSNFDYTCLFPWSVHRLDLLQKPSAFTEHTNNILTLSGFRTSSATVRVVENCAHLTYLYSARPPKLDFSAVYSNIRLKCVFNTDGPSHVSPGY
jgi:hypothetical protein